MCDGVFYDSYSHTSHLIVIPAKTPSWFGLPAARLSSVATLSDGGLAGDREETPPEVRVTSFMPAHFMRRNMVVVFFLLLILILLILLVSVLDWCRNWDLNGRIEKKHDSAHWWHDCLTNARLVLSIILFALFAVVLAQRTQ